MSISSEEGSPGLPHESSDPGESSTSALVRSQRVPRHVGIIMDGNGRWARTRGWHRTAGHARGTLRVKEIIREANRLKIEVLSLYCFSTENWSRPAGEISVLMELLKDYLLQEREELVSGNIRFRALGQVERLPPEVREIVNDTIQVTSDNTGLILNFCLSYGGRAEIVRAAQTLCREVQEGRLGLADINETSLSERLYTAGLPDPDLIIRTSGEFRISNFLLWQLAYAELYVTETLWPDFEPSHLRAAVEAYGQRKRRFGFTDEQVPKLKTSRTELLKAECDRDEKL